VTRAWETAYADGGVPTWDIGRPQPAVVRLLEAGAFGPPGWRILDAGCGTGDNALLLASRGHQVVGIDIAAQAIARARARAIELAPRPAPALLVGDALDAPAVAALGPFDAALDVGLFHALAEEQLPRYVASLASAVRPGGHAFVLCWSDRNPFGLGPRQVTRREIREAFRAASGWRVERIEPEELSSRLPGGTVHAWLARLTRRA
jgi:SAM-dependent methyltransferase